MTNLENIRNSTPESLAKFLHTIEALAIIEGKADSEINAAKLFSDVEKFKKGWEESE